MDLTKPVFLVSELEDFVVMFTDEGTSDYRMRWSGKVYPVTRYDDHFAFKLDQDMSDTQDETKARKWFDFSFCWRGVWEGRVYFTNDEFWGEDLSIINDLWNQIEKIMKDKIKEDNPDYGHFDFCFNQ